MTRVKISTLIVLILVGISAFSSVWVNEKCDEMLDKVVEICEISDSGDTEKLKELADNLNDQWEKFRSKASVLLKFDKLVEIDRLCSRIVKLAENGDPELNAELSELNDMLEMLKSCETPHFTSVF